MTRHPAPHDFRRRYGMLLILGGLVATLVGALASSAPAARPEIPPRAAAGPTTCAEVGYSGKLQFTAAVTDGMQYGISFAVTTDFDDDETTLAFSVSDGLLHAVVVRNGSHYNVYAYGGGAGESGSGLVVPPKNDGSPRTIKNVFMCYLADVVATTTTTTTTVPSETTTTTAASETTTTTAASETTTTTGAGETTTTSSEGSVTTLGVTTSTECVYGSGDCPEPPTTVTILVTSTTAGGSTTLAPTSAQTSNTGLPRTGSSSLPLFLLGLGLVLSGGAMIATSRAEAVGR